MDAIVTNGSLMYCATALDPTEYIVLIIEVGEIMSSFPHPHILMHSLEVVRPDIQVSATEQRCQTLESGHYHRGTFTSPDGHRRLLRVWSKKSEYSLHSEGPRQLLNDTMNLRLQHAR